jgi:hypothetical protein
MFEREISRGLFEKLVRRSSRGEEVNPGGVVAVATAIAFARGFLLCFMSIGVLTALALLLARNPGLSAHDYSLTLLVLEALGTGILFSVFVRRSGRRLLALAGGVAWALLVMNISHG